MSISIQIKGVQEVQKYLNNVNSKIYKTTNDAIKESGFYLQSEVQKSLAQGINAPKAFDTGNLTRSVKAEQKQPLTSTIYTNVSYAKYVEYGTTRMKKRPHFRNSAKKNEIKIKNFVESAIKNAI